MSARVREGYRYPKSFFLRTHRARRRAPDADRHDAGAARDETPNLMAGSSRAAGLGTRYEVRFCSAIRRCAHRRRSRVRGGAGGLGWLLRVGAGVGRRRVGVADGRGDAHRAHPARHDADAALAHAAVEARERDGHARQSVGRARDARRSASARRTRASRTSARRRTARSAPSCWTRGSTSSPACGAGSRSPTTASTTTSRRRSSRLRRRPCSSRASRSGWSARGRSRSRCSGRCATTASSRSARGENGDMRQATPDEVREIAAHVASTSRRHDRRSTSSSKARRPTSDPARAAAKVRPWREAGATWFLEARWGVTEGRTRSNSFAAASPPARLASTSAPRARPRDTLHAAPPPDYRSPTTGDRNDGPDRHTRHRFAAGARADARQPRR